jgi:hypothetical protein
MTNNPQNGRLVFRRKEVYPRELALQCDEQRIRVGPVGHARYVLERDPESHQDPAYGGRCYFGLPGGDELWELGQYAELAHSHQVRNKAFADRA